MTEKTEATAAAPAAEKAPSPYPNLSSNFLAPRATFKGRLKSVMKAFKDSGNDVNNAMVADFRKAMADGVVALPTEPVSHPQAKQLASIGLKLPDELLPKTPAPAEAAAEDAAPAADVTSAV
jgi:hypothetical protein